jgi:hypothetical protein
MLDLYKYNITYPDCMERDRLDLILPIGIKIDVLIHRDMTPCATILNSVEANGA